MAPLGHSELKNHIWIRALIIAYIRTSSDQCPIIFIEDDNSDTNETKTAMMMSIIMMVVNDNNNDCEIVTEA